MRHHTTSIVGPDLDGNEQALWAEMFPKHTTPVKDAADPDHYPSDLLAAIPWAKDAGLRLVEAGMDLGHGKWLYTMPSHYYNTEAKDWFRMGGLRVEVMFGYYHTRESALKSPPPKPPGFEEAKADQYPSDVLAACPMAREWGVEFVQDKDGYFGWRCDGLMFSKEDGWKPHGVWWTKRDRAFQNAPTIPPPGYVAPMVKAVDTSYDGGDSRSGPGVPPPAQPSVGERLGAVARDEWLATGAVARWDRIALAVRREVLKEVFAEEDVEAAAKAMWNATRPGITWDELREASRKPIWVQAAAALSAALASRVARESKVTP